MRAREREIVPPVMDLAAAEVDLAAAKGSDVGGCERGASCAGDEHAQEENRARAHEEVGGGGARDPSELRKKRAGSPHCCFGGFLAYQDEGRLGFTKVNRLYVFCSLFVIKLLSH